MPLSTTTIPIDKSVTSNVIPDQQDVLPIAEKIENIALSEECQVSCKQRAKTIEKEKSKVQSATEDSNIEKKCEMKKTIDTKLKSAVESVTTQTEILVEYNMIPIRKTSDAYEPFKMTTPRKVTPLPMSALDERPLVLATHLVPSLPIRLFEVLAEAIEIATEKPVVVLHEPRSDRPVAKEVTDIAILPANEKWQDGELLPVSFCFEHRLNKSDSPCVYVDVVVATDRAAHIKDIKDLRGHRCSLPDRHKQTGATALLFNHLYFRGEGPSFFGHTLDASTQIGALQMVARKQAEIGVVESPIIKCHKNTLPGVESLNILISLGPLPPYRIMVNKSLSDTIVRKITAYLLNISQDKEWVKRFAPFGVKSFTKNSMDLYNVGDMKSVVTSVPYY